jgi:hypothetical protein
MSLPRTAKCHCQRYCHALPMATATNLLGIVLTATHCQLLPDRLLPRLAGFFRTPANGSGSSGSEGNRSEAQG